MEDGRVHNGGVSFGIWQLTTGLILDFYDRFTNIYITLFALEEVSLTQQIIL